MGDPRIYGQMTFGQAVRLHSGGKTVGSVNLFSTTDARKPISMCKRMKLDPHLTPHAKINSEWTKDRHARAETTT